MKLSALRKKAQSGSLEVEHLLAAAIERPAGLQAELDRLAQELGWHLEDQLPDGRRVVPLARWAAVAGAYASQGFEGLSQRIPSDARFVIALAEEMRTAESLAFLLRAFATTMAHPSGALAVAGRLASALNQMLSFPAAAPVLEGQANAIRAFLEALMPLVDTDAHRAAVIMAFRGVGDARSVEFVEGLPDLAPPWQDARSATLRAIRKKMRQGACAEHDGRTTQEIRRET